MRTAYRLVELYRGGGSHTTVLDLVGHNSIDEIYATKKNRTYKSYVETLSIDILYTYKQKYCLTPGKEMIVYTYTDG